MTKKLAILLAIIIMIIPFSAFSYEENYLIKPQYWQNEAPVEVDVNDIDCLLKYKADEENDCIYFYVEIIDKAIQKLGEDDSLGFIFKLQNSSNSYVVKASSKDEDTNYYYSNKIIEHQNIPILNTRVGLVKVYFCLELKDSSDRRLLNNIELSYYCGNIHSYDLASDIKLNLAKVEVTKQTTSHVLEEKTARQDTTKSTTAKATSVKQIVTENVAGLSTSRRDKDTTFAPTSKSSTKASTSTLAKFEASADSKNKATDTTQFEATAKANDITSQTQFEPSTTTEATVQIVNEPTEAGVQLQAAKASVKSALGLGVAMALATIGVLLLIISLLASKYKLTKRD